MYVLFLCVQRPNVLTARNKTERWKSYCADWLRLIRVLLVPVQKS